MAVQLAVGAAQLAKALPILRGLAIGSGFSGAGVLGSAAVVRGVNDLVPGTRKALGQDDQTQARKRASKYNRATGEFQRSGVEKFMDFALGRDLTARGSGEKASAIQKASNEDILEQVSTELDELNDRGGDGRIDIPELGNRQSAEAYRNAINRKLTLLDEAEGVEALTGEKITGPVTKSKVSSAKATAPGGVLYNEKRDDILRLEEKLERAQNNKRSDDRYFQEMQMTRQQNANQFAMQMAQQARPTV